MSKEVFTQYVDPKVFETKTITVGGQNYKIDPEVKIFIKGKQVKFNNISAELKSFSTKEIETLKKQLSAIQKYSGQRGYTDEIERNDFESCDRNRVKKDGILFTFIGEDDARAKFGCINGKFELLW